MSDDHIPASADGYAATLPDNPAFAGLRIDTNDKRYLAAREAAHASRLTTKEFSVLLGVEAARVMRAAGHKAAPAKPTAAATDTRPWKSLSFAEKLARGGHV